ncbi:MAG: type II toxin-antitoxin system RelE/ParE family toxin [Oscillospiraceae bacterium]|nr:type II toxin-antitoxin system RelE/ParE family toxin [Oscillospiraceae bacterium]
MEIKYSKAAVKFLKKQNQPIQVRIMTAIEKIPAGDIVKLQGITGYRLRVGNYRIIFDFSGNIIDIIDIDNRGQIYK